jgi:ABC-type glycerol-3-phosphate transport system permease component
MTTLTAVARRSTDRASLARARTTKWLKGLVIYLILGLAAVTMIFPLLWLISSSLKTGEQQISWPPSLIPMPPHPQNYADLFRIAPMQVYTANSLLIAVLSMIGMCLSSSLAAFAFARLRFRGKEIVFSILLATMMVPFAMTLVPTFFIMRNLGWVNSLRPLIAPNFFGSAFMVFLLRQTYRGIPQDLMDAAKIDGASFFGIYRHIFLPLGMPGLVTVGLLTFLGSWNDLLGPLIYLNDQALYTVQIGLAMLKGRAGTGIGNMGVIMAGSLIGALPMLILYALGQKYFIQGLARTGMKG